MSRGLGILAAALLISWGVPAGGLRGGPLPVEEVAAGVYVHVGETADFTPGNRGGIANLGFVVGEEAVAVIDTGGSAAQGRDWLETVRSLTDRPVRWVVVTHLHPDHLLGTAAFAAAGARVWGHAALPRAIAERGPSYLARMADLLGPAVEGTTLPRIDETVAVGEARELDLGGRVLELRAWPTAHTDGDLTVFDRATGILFTGDLLFVDRLPVIDGSLPGWLAVLDELARIPASGAVPGHGPATVPWPAALAAERAYLGELRDAVRAVLRRGLSLAQAVTAVPPPDPGNWRLIEPDHGRNVVAAYAELEWE